ncbi:hypothetical protein BD779DRAFT_1674902 [Infundibulicybe gibba]|nr:hypothetical protein BD779DRAFT_1674902 [Infundibulicybe gibba]
MDSDFVDCDLGTFRRSYLPFDPSKEDIQRGLQALRDHGQASDDLRWKSFSQPSRRYGTETQIFSPLQDMFDALIECRLSGENAGRRCNLYSGTIQINPSSLAFLGAITRSMDRSSGWARGAQKIAEFKPNDNDKDTYHDNQIKVVGASNHIMNDDVRRMFTFGITIEDDQMTLWYFSRSHSAYPLLSIISRILRASPPSLSPLCSPKWEQSGKKRYFQTRGLIAEYRSLCITGRMTRVWKAVELDQEQTSVVGEPVVLKDIWLEEAAQTEKQIQDKIFSDIRSFADVLKKDKYKDYFLHILCDYQGETTKPLAPTASTKFGLFNTPVSTSAPSTSRSLPNPTREFDPVTHSSCTTRARDTLQLLYCAGWVHRDISSGNILAYTVGGAVRGKLADLEYAKKFASNSENSDPKTGTPFFMPLEIQDQEYFSQPASQGVPQVTYGMEPMTHAQVDRPVRFNFQHDLESLWWVLLWVITEGPDHTSSRKFADKIFQNRPQASTQRRRVVKNSNYLLEVAGFHPSVLTYGDSLSRCMVALYLSYLDREQKDRLDESASYAGAHGEVYRLFEYLKTTFNGNEDVAIELLRKRGSDANNPSNVPQRMKPGPPKDESDRQPEEDDGGSPSQEIRHPKRSRRSSGAPEGDSDYQPEGSDESEASQENRRPKRSRQSFGYR